MYPILSTIAYDLLTILVSTVVSESAFSAGGRVLDERQWWMTLASLEMQVLLKDWCDTDERKQGLLQDNFYEDTSSSNSPHQSGIEVYNFI